MIDAIENLAKWLSSKAKITLDLVDDNKIDDANEFIKLARKEIISTRQRLSEAISQIRSLQAEFIGLSDAVGNIN